MQQWAAAFRQGDRECSAEKALKLLRKAELQELAARWLPDDTDVVFNYVDDLREALLPFALERVDEVVALSVVWCARDQLDKLSPERLRAVATKLGATTTPTKTQSAYVEELAPLLGNQWTSLKDALRDGGPQAFKTWLVRVKPAAC